MTTKLIKGMMVLTSAAAIALMASAPVQAESQNSFCKRYAKTATWQYKQSIKLECQYSGAYWHPAKSLHKLWCLGQDRDVARDGNDYRAQKLSICQAQGEN